MTRRAAPMFAGKALEADPLRGSAQGRVATEVRAPRREIAEDRDAGLAIKTGAGNLDVASFFFAGRKTLRQRRRAYRRLE